MEPIQLESIHASPPSPRRSSRIFYPLKRYLGIITENVEKMFLIENGVHGDDSKTYDETISDNDFKEWLETMKSKIDSMQSN